MTCPLFNLSFLFTQIKNYVFVTIDNLNTVQYIQCCMTSEHMYITKILLPMSQLFLNYGNAFLITPGISMDYPETMYKREVLTKASFSQCQFLLNLI